MMQDLIWVLLHILVAQLLSGDMHTHCKLMIGWIYELFQNNHSHLWAGSIGIAAVMAHTVHYGLWFDGRLLLGFPESAGVRKARSGRQVSHITARCLADSYHTFNRQRTLLRRPKMFLTPSISCLFVAALCVQADPYRERIGSLGEFDVRAGWGSKEFGITDNGRPSVEDFDGTDTTSVENFGTPRTPTEGSTKSRTFGSWSSWSRKPNFPKRNGTKTRTPRSRGGNPMTRPDYSAVERIVVFPCQDAQLRWDIIYHQLHDQPEPQCVDLNLKNNLNFFFDPQSILISPTVQV